jgi:hypothetical protein
MKGDSHCHTVVARSPDSIVTRRAVLRSSDKDTYRDRKRVVDKSASIRIQHVSIPSRI